MLNTRRRLTGAGTRDAKGVHAPYNAEDVMVEDCRDLDLTTIFILKDAVEIEALAASLKNLLVLLLQTGNGVARASGGCSRRSLESEAVEGLSGLSVGHDGLEMNFVAARGGMQLQSSQAHRGLLVKADKVEAREND